MSRHEYNVEDILEEIRAKKHTLSTGKSEEPTYRQGGGQNHQAEQRPQTPPGMMSVRPIDPAHLTARRRREQERKMKEHIESSLREENPLSPDTANFSLHFSLEELEEETFVSDETQEVARVGFGMGKERLTDSFVPLEHVDQRDYEMAQITAEQPMPKRPGEEPRRQRKDLGDGWQSWQQSQDEEVFTQEQAQQELAALKKTHILLWVRIVALFGVLCLSLYLAFSLHPLPFGETFGLGNDFLLMLPGFMVPEEYPRAFIAANLCTGILGVLLTLDLMGKGLRSLLSLRATSDTPAALAAIFALLQSVVLLFFPDQLLPVEGGELPAVSIYIPLALAALWFTLLGKTLLHDRVYRNFALLCKVPGKKGRHGFVQITEGDYIRVFLRGFGPFMEYMGFSSTVSQVSNFFQNSYTGDYSDNYYRASAPMSILGGFLLGAVTWYMTRDVVTMIGAITATICICAPFSSGIVPNLMLHRVNKWLNKRDGFITGYETAHELASRGVILVDEKDLYGQESVILHGMKVFAEKRVDEALLDAASVVLACNGVMSSVFLNMIGGNTRMLRPVEGILYEDGMGISAWVDRKRVLIGNRELMRNHAVPCPSADFESRYTYDGRQALYIANSGEISAMFVVSYNPDPRIVSQMLKLEKRGIGFLVFTTDPNITQDQITAGFGLRKASVRILPTKLHAEYAQLTDPLEKSPVGCIHSGGIGGVLNLVEGASSVCRSVRVGAVLQLISIIVGYGLMALLSFTNGLEAASFYYLGLFSLGAFLLTWLTTNFGRA